MTGRRGTERLLRRFEFCPPQESRARARCVGVIARLQDTPTLIGLCEANSSESCTIAKRSLTWTVGTSSSSAYACRRESADSKLRFVMRSQHHANSSDTRSSANCLTNVMLEVRAEVARWRCSCTKDAGWSGNCFLNRIEPRLCAPSGASWRRLWSRNRRDYHDRARSGPRSTDFPSGQ
jgi:hypothetical protein